MAAAHHGCPNSYHLVEILTRGFPAGTRRDPRAGAHVRCFAERGFGNQPMGQ